MAVYYKFKSAKDFDSIPIDGHFVSVGILKQKIFESKQFGRGNDFDLEVTNAQTNEEYADDESLIPKNTSVLIRRVPGRPRLRNVALQERKVEPKVEILEPPTSNFTGAGSSAMHNLDYSEYDDEFGSDLYAIPDAQPIQYNNPIQDAPAPTKEDEDSKIQALIETPALDYWQQQPGDGYGRGFGRGGGRINAGRGFGRSGPGSKSVPPQGYVCHRCKVPGHYIQHCPTNGNPEYDVKRVRPPTGIPKSMLIETPDGSYSLPSGSVAVLKPNEAAFEREIEGLPTTRSMGEVPPQHLCPLCKEIMKDAVITIKCCFATFCDKCIRDHIISKSACVCGEKDVLADDLRPNKLVRDSITVFLESNNNNSSADNAGSIHQVQDVESARCPPARVPSPTLSAASKGEQPHVSKDTMGAKPSVDEGEAASAPHPAPDMGDHSKIPVISEATRDSVSIKEPASQLGAPHAEEEVQQKVPAETGKKTKKKKARAPANGADMQWKNGQDFGTENYMMPMPPGGFNPYWNGMQPGMEAYMPPFGGHMPLMGVFPPFGPMDMPYGGLMPQDPFSAQGFMYPPVRPQPPSQRDLGDFGMGYNSGPPPAMSREEFEARKANLRRKREMEERRRDGSTGGGDFPPRNREHSSKEAIGRSTTEKLKSRIEEDDRDYHHRHRHSTSSRHHSPSPRRSSHSSRLTPPPPPHRDIDLPRPLKRKSSERDHHPDDDHHRRREPQSDRDRHHHRRSESRDRAPSSRSEAAPVRDPAPAKTAEAPPTKPRSESKSTSSAAAAAAAAAATTSVAAAEGKNKTSVFARISFPEEGGSKKRKVSSSMSVGTSAKRGGGDVPSSVAAVSNGGTSKRKNGSMSAESYAESSDEDRHFKRKPSRYEASPVDPDRGYSGSRHPR